MLVQESVNYIALANILLIALITIQGIAFLIRHIYYRHHNHKASGSIRLAAIMGCISAVIMWAVFFLTEDLSAPIKMVDDLTLTMLAIVGANGILEYASGGEEDGEEQFEESEYAVAE